MNTIYQKIFVGIIAALSIVLLIFSIRNQVTISIVFSSFVIFFSILYIITTVKPNSFIVPVPYLNLNLDRLKIPLQRSKLFEHSIKYVFLASLFLITLGSLQFDFIQSTPLLKGVVPWLADNSTLFTIFAIISGGITFWINRKNIEKDKEQELVQEDLAEQQCTIDFPEKYPLINKIPILRNLVRWMYKEGWLYSIFVVTLFLTGFLIRIWSLGKLSLWWDELITGTYITRILELGVPLSPSGLEYYWRGGIYHYIVSIFNYIFGNTEFWLRFPSILFGMGIIFIAFMLARKINKEVALIVLFFLIFSTYNIEYSSFARFYIMNAFLFMLAIWFVWLGFFKNKIKYKIYSLITFFIMLNTVQLGMIYVSLILTWGIFFASEILMSFKNAKNILYKNLQNIKWLTTGLLLIPLNILLHELLPSINLLVRAKEITEVTPAREWHYLQIPEWNLLSFFNDNYFPIILLLIGVMLGIYLLIASIKKKGFDLFSYIVLVFLVSILLYEIGSRGVTGARIYLYAEPLVAFLGIFSIYYTLILIAGNNTQKKVGVQMFTGLIILLLLWNIGPTFYERKTITYGDSVEDDPFRSTHVAAYRSDNKTTYKFLEKNIRENDIWINVIENNYFNYNSTPDYILNQSTRWNTNALITEDGDFISPRTGALLINEVEDIKDIINKNKNKKVWLLVNGGSVNVLHTTHVKSDFLVFLKENRSSVVYESPDMYSKVFLFND